MFTGLVQELGKVMNIEGRHAAIKLTISAKKILTGIQIGDSIAVNGTCLTVVDLKEGSFIADVMPETYKISILGKLNIGDSVNLERPVQVGERLEGHIVTGHVDGIGVIQAKDKQQNAYFIKISVGENIAKYVVRKGSVAVDGISLTVIDVGSNWFTVSLIPHTSMVTTLGLKATGDLVNIETDILGRYVERLMSANNNKKAGLTLQMLVENGF